MAKNLGIVTYHKSGALSCMLAGLILPNMALAVDPTCISYYTIGDSTCKPVASTPVQRQPAPVKGAPQLVNPPSEVDKFLENYGKPPREFVEFYLNPTPENARKWVSTYQGIIQKSQDISKAWNQADELYRTSSTTPPATRSSVQPLPAQQSIQSMPTAPVNQAPQAPVARFGAFAESTGTSSSQAAGIRMSPINVTYYFSQTCPYCAKMTPDLAALSNEKASKLELTCVDVTPIGPNNRPDEAYITSKLPCKWRLPVEGEIDQEGVRQTPTLVIRKEGQSPVRLSGYVPLTQLRQYF